MKTYPYMERAPYNVEVPHCRNGKPGYRWAPGWQIVYSPTRIGCAVTYNAARTELKDARHAQG